MLDLVTFENADATSHLDKPFALWNERKKAYQHCTHIFSYNWVCMMDPDFMKAMVTKLNLTMFKLLAWSADKHRTLNTYKLKARYLGMMTGSTSCGSTHNIYFYAKVITDKGCEDSSDEEMKDEEYNSALSTHVGDRSITNGLGISSNGGTGLIIRNEELKHSTQREQLNSLRAASLKTLLNQAHKTKIDGTLPASSNCEWKLSTDELLLINDRMKCIITSEMKQGEFATVYCGVMSKHPFDQVAVKVYHNVGSTNA